MQQEPSHDSRAGAALCGQPADGADVVAGHLLSLGRQQEPNHVVTREAGREHGPEPDPVAPHGYRRQQAPGTGIGPGSVRA